MQYRLLDENKDYSFGKGSQNMITGTEAVAQAIYTRLLLLQGEWWEDLDDGLPLMQRILGFRNTQQAADLLIRQRILGTTGVNDLYNFSSEFDPATRAYTFSCTVNTIYGETYLTEVTI